MTTNNNRLWFEPVEDWSNDACLGYVILALEQSGYKQIEIDKIVRAVRSTLDQTSLGQARIHYGRSPY